MYYHLNKRKVDNKFSREEIKLENEIIKAFRKSRNNYGTRKIKKNYNVREWLFLGVK